MKKQFLLSIVTAAVVTLCGIETSFSQPYASNDECVFFRSTGKGITLAELPTKSHLWSKGMDFTCWNGYITCGNKYAIGSQNHPVMAAMGWGDYKWIAELCRWEKGHGIFGRELGAPAYYFANVLGSKIVALRDARAAGAYADAKDIAESLRAVWAYEALISIATPRKNVWQNLAGKIYTNTGDVSWYNGLTAASAGDRWRTENNISHDTHGEYTGWAIDWQPRSRTPNKNLLTSNGKWWSESTAQCSGVPYYDQTAAPEVFGLNAAERQKLKDVINGDVNAAKWAAEVVANFGTWKDYPNCGVFHKIRIRRTALGVEMVYFMSTNGNKPTQAATQVFHNGDYKSIRPSYYKGTGANGGYNCWVANGSIHADCTPGAGEYVSMPEMGGAILWEVNIDGSVINFNGNNVTPAGQATYPNGPDVGVTAITAPGSNITSATVTPKATIKNFGAATLNNVYVSYQLNNGPMWTTTWRGTLAPNATVNVTLWNAPVATGNYTLKVYTGGPNYRPDGNTSNDLQTHNFTVGNTPTQTLDAGINTIVSPTSSITADSIQPVGEIKNFGTLALTSANISYKINNGTPVTQPWTGNLASGASVNHTFPKVPIAQGTYTIQIYTANPNGGADANATNDSQSLVFNVTSPNITDAEAVSVGEPLALGCLTTVSPLLVVKNIGPEIMDQITINYQVDAGPVVSRSYSVATGTGLKVDSAMGLRGNPSTVGVGAHTLTIWTSVPNNAADADFTNDTVSYPFTVGTAGQALPFSENFETVNGGDIPSTWTRYNPDAHEDWFVYGMTGNKAMAFNNFAYTGAINKKDNLTLPILNLTGSSSAFITFDLAHASRPAPTTYDSLELRVSTDCGATYQHVWGLGGPGLNTTPDDATIFIPAGPQDYKSITVDLSAYTASNNAIIRFINWSNNGNSTLIDNVNITATVTAVEESASVLSVNVFPNPATESIQINSQFNRSGELKMKLVNALGQTMEEVNYGVQQGYYSAKVDVKNYPSGIYNILVSSGDNQMISKKVVVVK